MGLETRQQIEPLSGDPERPEWLVGAADVLESSEEAPVATARSGRPTQELTRIPRSR